MNTNSGKRTNWKKIAEELFDRVSLAMHNCDFRQSIGTGVIVNNDTGKRRWWREYIGRIAGKGELRWIKKCQLCKMAKEV